MTNQASVVRCTSCSNVLARVPKGNSGMVAAAIRTVFAQPDAEHVHAQLDVIATMLGRQFPAVETMLRDAKDDVLAFTGFPVLHWKKILVVMSKRLPQAACKRAHSLMDPTMVTRAGPATDTSSCPCHRLIGFVQ